MLNSLTNQENKDGGCIWSVSHNLPTPVLNCTKITMSADSVCILCILLIPSTHFLSLPHYSITNVEFCLWFCLFVCSSFLPLSKLDKIHYLPSLNTASIKTVDQTFLPLCAHFQHLWRKQWPVSFCWTSQLVLIWYQNLFFIIRTLLLQMLPFC